MHSIVNNISHTVKKRNTIENAVFFYTTGLEITDFYIQLKPQYVKW